MITILIVGNNIADNERIAGSIIGGTELTTCIICTRSAPEALNIINRKDYKIDLFVISVKMKEQSGYRLAEKIRKMWEYRNCPILFVTNASYSLAGFSSLTTYQSYKNYNYISLPITRVDVQGKLGLYLEDMIKKQSNQHDLERVVFLAHTKGETLVSIKNILFAEVQSKVCRVYTAEDTYTLNRRTLDQIIEIIDDDSFLRCHRSFALNIKQIKGIEKIDRRSWKAVFDINAETCLISKTYIDSIMDAYKAFRVK